MIKKRDLIIILICATIVLSLVWYWLYFLPARERTRDWQERTVVREAAIASRYAAAHRRRDTYAELTVEYQRIRELWDIEAAALPIRFEDTDVLEQIQRVIYPHVGSVSLGFSDSTQRHGDLLWSTSINLSFTTTYWQFLSILNDLVYADLGNRVINYTLDVSPLTHGEFFYMVQGPAVDYLSDEMFYELQQFTAYVQAEFGGPNAPIGEEVIGSYTLAVTMTVEYIGLEAGRKSEGTWRGIWAREDAMAAAASAY